MIWLPFRYWDRFRERSADPELSYFGVSLEQGPVFFESFGWQLEDRDALVDLECYLRIDGRGEFSDDLEQPGELMLLTEGQVGDDLNPIDRPGSLIEARFAVKYRAGCFDPVTFMAQAWKKAPMLKWFGLRYQGESRILAEKVTAR